MKKIGIIGCGFVGKAVASGFSLHSKIRIYDKYDNSYDSLNDTVNESDYLFICVPTPMDENGKQDLSIIYEVIESVVEITNSKKTIILKSTIIPGTTRMMAEKYSDHDFVFNPEFLTQRTAHLDFINASRIIIGGLKEATDHVELLYRDRFVATPIFKTTWEAAEVVKYMCNCFFAMKISFLNEFYDIANHIGVPFEELRNMWIADGRIGNSHIDVPGHDGDRGYGGKCFPKDVRSFFNWAESIGCTAYMPRAANHVNNLVRNNKDWLDIKGATSHNSYDR